MVVVAGVLDTSGALDLVSFGVICVPTKQFVKTNQLNKINY